MQTQFNPMVARTPGPSTSKTVEDPNITRSKQLIGEFKTKIGQILPQPIQTNNPTLRDWQDLAGSIVAATIGSVYEPHRDSKDYSYREFNQTMDTVLRTLNTINPMIILPLLQRGSRIFLSEVPTSPPMAPPVAQQLRISLPPLPRPIFQNESRASFTIPSNVEAQLQSYKNAHSEYGAALLFYDQRNPNEIVSSLDDPDVINENGQITISPQTMAIISEIERRSGLHFSMLVAQWGRSTRPDDMADFTIRPFSSEEVTRLQQSNGQRFSVANPDSISQVSSRSIDQPQSYSLNGFSFGQEAMNGIKQFYTLENFPYEKGGLLFGPRGRDEVTAFLEDPSPGTSSVEWIPPDNYAEVVRSAEHMNPNMEFKGFIHSHPTWFGANPSGPDIESFLRIQEANPTKRYIYPILAQDANSRSYNNALSLGNNWQIVGHVFR